MDACFAAMGVYPLTRSASFSAGVERKMGHSKLLPLCTHNNSNNTTQHNQQCMCIWCGRRVIVHDTSFRKQVLLSTYDWTGPFLFLQNHGTCGGQLNKGYRWTFITLKKPYDVWTDEIHPPTVQAWITEHWILKPLNQRGQILLSKMWRFRGDISHSPSTFVGILRHVRTEGTKSQAHHLDAVHGLLCLIAGRETWDFHSGELMASLSTRWLSESLKYARM